ncbi:MAG TPA: phosphoglycerate dehydrogenase [Firmicutes bacterium]|nr:phosphoglycerate dehydrogenase [Bacillota bacterium]HOQ24378.1 phosphoglycerate dehydrogenase [Bacillota bacterium]HPT67653.1 phosphoglycerate dehydrogenase [Bacillota bacterium]
MKVLVLDGVSEKAIAILRENGIQADVSPTLPLPELVAKIPEYEGVIVRSQTKVTAEVIEAGAKLKVIGRAGVGVDNVDVEAATKRGIVVMNAPDGNTISTAEHTIAMIMALSRNIPQAHCSLKAGQWDRKSFTGVEVNNKVLGIIGMGRIGTEVAKRMQAMGMKILAYDPFLAEERAQMLGVKLATLDEIYANADYITVHTPLTPETKNLINAETIAKMKKGVRIINCARGGILNEDDVAAAIEAGQVAGVAVDVYPEEPPVNRRLIELDKVIATPHLGASTKEAQVNVAIDVAVEMSKCLKGEAFKNAVNIPSVRPEVLAVVKPYFSLAEKLGLMITQLCTGRIEKVEIGYEGEIAEYDVSLLTTMIMKGILRPVLDVEVNMVNAQLLAKQRGIKIAENKEATSPDYTNRITVKVYTSKTVHTVAGTLFRKDDERVVEIDGYYFEVVPHGNLLVAPHEDRPGIIGKVGTVLGEAGINIAFMQVGRRDQGGTAIMVMTVDNPIDDATLAKVAAVPGILDARVVKL